MGGFAAGSAKPAVNQTIEVRYDPDCGKISYAKFSAAKAPPPTSPRIQFYILDSVFPKRVKSGDPITVSWTSYAGHSAIDWIGLYPVSAYSVSSPDLMPDEQNPGQTPEQPGPITCRRPNDR